MYILNLTDLFFMIFNKKCFLSKYEIMIVIYLNVNIVCDNIQILFYCIYNV